MNSLNLRLVNVSSRDFEHRRALRRALITVLFVGVSVATSVAGCGKPATEEIPQSILAIEVLQQSIDGLKPEYKEDPYMAKYFISAHNRAIEYLRKLSDDTASKPYPILAVVQGSGDSGSRLLLIQWYQEGATEPFNVSIYGKNKTKALAAANITEAGVKQSYEASTGMALAALHIVKTAEDGKQLKLGGLAVGYIVVGTDEVPEPLTVVLSSKRGSSPAVDIFVKPVDDVPNAK
jgi:hypothetical protein